MKQMKIVEIYSQINSEISSTIPEIVIYNNKTYLYNKSTNDYYRTGSKDRLFRDVKNLSVLAEVSYMGIKELIQYNNDLIDLIDLCNRSRECRSDLYKQLNGLRDYMKNSEYLKNSRCSEEIEKYLEEIENDIDNL